MREEGGLTVIKYIIYMYIYFNLELRNKKLNKNVELVLEQG